MRVAMVAAMGLALGGPLLAGALALLYLLWRRLRGRAKKQSFRPVLLLILVELRAGRSVLAALQAASRAFPEHAALSRVTRVASVSGLPAAVEVADDPVDRLVAQLARCQRSGAPVAETVRSILEADIEAERSRRIERARGLPIRLMIPIALLVLPGLVLLLYTPALIRIWQDMSAPFT